MKKAVVLLSGGIDSATTLYLARKQSFKCFCLIFDYAQRHRREIESAKKIAEVTDCSYKILKIRFPWKGSSLLDRKVKIPQCNNRTVQKHNNLIPSTYVPGRNIIFLSFALSFAEAVGAQIISIGAHIHDYSGYPDCRPEFYHAFSRVIATGTKVGVEKGKIKIETPLIRKTKAQIILLGRQLGVPFGLTWSCYHGGKRPCGRCDSCYFRARGFAEAGISDPLIQGGPLLQPKQTEKCY